VRDSTNSGRFISRPSSSKALSFTSSALQSIRKLNLQVCAEAKARGEVEAITTLPRLGWTFVTVKCQASYMWVFVSVVSEQRRSSTN
jgi:hypothetical protein